MNAREAYNQLIAEGGNPTNFFVGTRGSASDAIGLIQDGKIWKVFYTERGLDSPPSFTSESESEAAEYFYPTLSQESHLHLVGFFQEEEQARDLEKKIESIRIKAIRNDIPNDRFTEDRRYRVFVAGADIFLTREKIGTEKKQTLGKR